MTNINKFFLFLIIFVSLINFFLSGYSSKLSYINFFIFGSVIVALYLINIKNYSS